MKFNYLKKKNLLEILHIIYFFTIKKQIISINFFLKHIKNIIIKEFHYSKK
jgi:hypothetical protein